MDTLAITRFASGAYGYEINSPLWSDQADKERAFVLPPGGKIHVADCAAQPNGCLDAADEGKWVFPAGTTLLKSFGFDGKLVETRLLVALPDGTWVGYSYQWNEGQTGATLVASAGASASFNTGSRTVDWTYPGRRDCTECHTRSAGWTLGPETAQMNRVPITAALGTGNQIDKLAAAGLFDSAPAKPYKAALVTPYAGQLGGPPASATVTERARSYLHANCAFCHRPDGQFNSVDSPLRRRFRTHRSLQRGARQGDTRRRERDEPDPRSRRALDNLAAHGDARQGAHAAPRERRRRRRRPRPRDRLDQRDPGVPMSQRRP